MKLVVDDVEYWRQRAEDLRASAAKMNDPDAKTIFLKFAAEYDKLAKREANQREAFVDSTMTAGGRGETGH